MSFNTKEYQYTYFATGKTTQVATGKGTLGYITVNTPTAGTITVIDGTSGSTGNIAVITSASGEPFTLHYNVSFNAGLRIITSTTMDVTVCWCQS